MKINPKNVQKTTQLNRSVNTRPDPAANSQPILSELQSSQGISQVQRLRAPRGLIQILPDSPSAKVFATPSSRTCRVQSLSLFDPSIQPNLTTSHRKNTSMSTYFYCYYFIFFSPFNLNRFRTLHADSSTSKGLWT